jgi:hypothetical protein
MEEGMTMSMSMGKASKWKASGAVGASHALV